MQRYFIYFSYDGANYHGWQIQPNGNSVQAELQKALTMLLGRETLVVGAGRTDTGVHARMMVAHFDSEASIEAPQLAYRLNRILPQDISVSKVEPVDAGMHARFSATARTYRYFIHTEKNPFLRRYSCELHYRLNFDTMNEAAAYLLTQSDFASFCKAGADVKTTLCQVRSAAWHQLEPNSWYFEISANRFLRNMVRAVVGTLIEVGRGRMTVEEFKQVVADRQRTSAGESMPGHALFLEKIEY